MSEADSKRLCEISEVRCPDSCNQMESEQGCHFRSGPDRFTCTKCHLRIWRHFLEYELTPTDLQEMLHGEKITATEKSLTRIKEGKKIVTRGRLMLDEQYRVRIAPKIKGREATSEPCPKCGKHNLQLLTNLDGSRWYGCSGYPECRFTRAHVPHTFRTAVLSQEQTKMRPEIFEHQKQPGTLEKANRPRLEVNLDAQTGEPRDIYRHIPDFILRMLRLHRESAAKPKISGNRVVVQDI